MYAMTKNLLSREDLRVFEQQAKANVSETTTNEKSAIEEVTTNFFPPKAFQH